MSESSISRSQASPDVRPPDGWNGATSVFFPGCALRQTSPSLAKTTCNWLVGHGFCRDASAACCSLPVQYRGETARFEKAISTLVAVLARKKGYETVVAACPNCYYALKQAAASLAGETKLEIVALPKLLADAGCRIDAELFAGVRFAVHDSCPDREELVYATAMRTLCEGLDLAEMAHNRADAICCGSGREYFGWPFDKQVALGEARIAEAADIGADGVIAGCATCTYALSCTNSPVGVYHYLELLFGAPFGE